MKTAEHRLPGLVLSDHEIRVPLDHARPDGGAITVYAREVVAAGREQDELPSLVFLQGGPGHAAPRPAEKSGWVGRAVDEFRVVLLDQRGTGRSTPQTFQTLADLAPADQAARLRHFRSDSIVADCEVVRRELAGDEPWTVLGQSYGGFCATRYLSAAPQGLAAVLITGGLPPLDAHPDEIYRRTYKTVREKNERYYERYPGDVERVQAIARYLARNDVRLPTGGRLTVRRFQQLGLQLGFSDGFEVLHYLFESAFSGAASGDELSYAFLRGFESSLDFDTNPIFSVLHEACYAQGFATGWSAERIRAEYPEFEPSADGPLHFTGEMIYPWMFEEYPTLEPLREAAELLAQADDWPHLYDRDALARNEVPAAAAIYHDDMYVDRELSCETAAAIRGLDPWITNELEHNGLRADGERVLGRLLDRVRGKC